MGHKVNPNSFRLINDKNWKSSWFSLHNNASLLAEDINMRKVIMEKLGRNSGVEKIEIKINSQETIINVYTSKPGIIIGRSGQGIDDLRKLLERKIAQFRDQNKYVFPIFNKLENEKNINKKMKINILEIRTPELSAPIMAQNVATQLEKRIAHRRASKQAIEKIMEKGAKGAKIIVSGRLGGAEIARTEKYTQGSIPLGRIKANIDYAQADAFTTYGVIGVKVWIHKAPESPRKETTDINTDKHRSA